MFSSAVYVTGTEESPRIKLQLNVFRTCTCLVRLQVVYSFMWFSTHLGTTKTLNLSDREYINV